MRIPFVAAALLGLLVATPTFATDVPPSLQAELLQLYAARNKAVASGDLEGALAQYTSERRKSIEEGANTGNGRQQVYGLLKMMAPWVALPEPKTNADGRTLVIEMLRVTTPDSFMVKDASLTGNGNSASIVIDGTKTVTPEMKAAIGKDGPPVGRAMHSDLTLDFKMEGGAWKFDGTNFGRHPSAPTLASCTDDRYEPVTAYDPRHQTNLGGPLTRIQFAPDYTLLGVRVLDEEYCAFLPDKDTLKRRGFDPAQLRVDAIVEIDGIVNKTNKRKVWVEHLKMRHPPDRGAQSQP